MTKYFVCKVRKHLVRSYSRGLSPFSLSSHQFSKRVPMESTSRTPVKAQDRDLLT